VLQIPRVGVTESFLDLGGDSLSSLKVVVRMKKLGIADNVARGILQGKTIRQLARGELGEGDTASLPPQAQSNLLVNLVRGVLAVIVIMEHWMEGFFPDLHEQLDPYLGLLFLGGLLLRFMVGPLDSEDHAASAGLVGADPPRRDTGTPPPPEGSPLTGPERRVLAVLGLTTVLWLTDAVHGWNPAVPALLAAVLLLAPGIGVFTWRDFEQTVSWGLVFTVGVSLSLAQALGETGAAAWFARILVGGLPHLAERPEALAVALLIVVSVVHLGITNMSACIALLIPVATTVAQATGLNPIACGLLVLIAVDVVILYPVQTATNLMAYETGFYGARDVVRLGLALLALLIVFTLVAILPYWRLMDLPLAG
jgi:hypothetical protein